MVSDNRIFLVYLGRDLTERGGPDPGWRMVPLVRHNEPCEARSLAFSIADTLLAGVAHRASPYEWGGGKCDAPQRFAFCYREVIRDRPDTPAYAVAVEWCIDEVHRDDDCIKHGPCIVAITDPEPVKGDASVVSAPIVRAP